MELEQSEIDRFTKPHINRPQIQTILNFKPRNLDIYRQSLLHKSVLRLIKSLPSEYQVPKYMMESNERLEYLGDSVISMVTADYLYHKYPKEEEGFLTRVRSKLVDTNALSKFALKIGLNKYILMSKHLQSLDKRNKEKMLENAYEAWIGAIYLDLGIDYARKFIHDQYEKHVEWDKVVEDTNYKDQILRYCQSNNMELPVYNVIGQEGPPHNRIFTIQLQISDKVYSQGKGPQKKIGEQIAAQNTLKQINNNM